MTNGRGTGVFFGGYVIYPDPQVATL